MMSRAGSVIDVGELHAATRFWDRYRGLRGRSVSEIGPGLWLPACNCVHTLGMRAAIDVVFVDRGGQAVRVVGAVQPWRFVFGGWRARGVLEFPSGRATELGISPGSRLQWHAT